MCGMKHGLMIHVSVFLAAAAIGSIDTSGTSMLDELKKTLERRGLQDPWNSWFKQNTAQSPLIQPSRVICQKPSASVENFNGFGDWLVQEIFRELSFYWGIIRDAAPQKNGN